MKEKLNTSHLIKLFFSNYLWFGIVIVLISVILNNYLDTDIFIIETFIGVLNAIGIAIVVAAFFTFASGTSEFLNKISGLLRDIVIGKEFLNNLDGETKKNILSAIIKPSYAEKIIYSNIEDYFNRYISKTMKATKTSVRSNYNLSHRAYICSEKNIVTIESILSYRLYPGVDGFTPVKLAFYHYDKLSTCNYIYLYTPSGDREKYENNDIEYNETETEVGRVRVVSADTSKYNKLHSHLDIEIKMQECYYDHWGIAELQFLLPTDGFTYQLRCEDNLEIKQYSTFVYGAKCFIDKKENHVLSISCTEWITEGTGFSIVIGPNDKIICKDWNIKEEIDSSGLH